MTSCIYEGTVRHRRFAPVPHAFTYRLFMMYLDLAELPRLFRGRWLWSAGRIAPAWFRRGDYPGDPAEPLDETIRGLVAGRTGRRPEGPIRLLTHLRYWGVRMNPVSFYYCFDAAGEEVEAVVAEVTNTPWQERHCYVLPGPARATHRFPKTFHVSPFMPMAQDYHWRFTPPGHRLAVHMENHAEGQRMFDATLLLRRRAITPGALDGLLLRFPVMTLRVAGAIYLEAFRLWRKRAPFHPHPGRAG